MSEKFFSVKVSQDTYKRLKLLTIVEQKHMSKVLDEIVKEKYGLRKKEIEDLVTNTSRKTKVRDD